MPESSQATGFLAEIAKAGKQHPGLLKPDDIKLQMSVGALTRLLRTFYDAGYRQGADTLSLFDNIFGKRP